MLSKSKEGPGDGVDMIVWKEAKCERSEQGVRGKEGEKQGRRQLGVMKE